MVPPQNVTRATSNTHLKTLTPIFHQKHSKYSNNSNKSKCQISRLNTVNVTEHSTASLHRHLKMHTSIMKVHTSSTVDISSLRVLSPLLLTVSPQATFIMVLIIAMFFLVDNAALSSPPLSNSKCAQTAGTRSPWVWLLAPRF